MSTDLMHYSQISDNSLIDSSFTIGVGTASPMNCYDYYHYRYPDYCQPWTSTSFSYICTCQNRDTGKQAFELVKKLQDMKVIKLTTVKQFVDTMDAVLKIL